jgi:hypothetical protein
MLQGIIGSLLQRLHWPAMHLGTNLHWVPLVKPHEINPLVMVTPTGFEPVTPRLGIWCSIQLSYGAESALRPLLLFLPQRGKQRRKERARPKPGSKGTGCGATSPWQENYEQPASWRQIKHG